MRFLLVLTLILISSIAADSKNEIVALQTAFKKAANRISPYVVQIKVHRTKDIPLPPPSFFLQDFETLPRVHRKDWKRFLEETIQVSKRPKGNVSGVMIGIGGEIITSYYNVAGSVRRIQVFVGGISYAAKIVAYSKLDDIALLRIPKKIKAVSIRARQPQLGNWAIVVAKSKSNKHYTINTGIVSGTKRYKGYSAQLDAKVNHGNAGGAVTDIYGNFIGIVNRVSHYAKSGQSSGVGFFTTSKRLLRVIPLLRSGKNIAIPTRPFLGIRVSRMQAHRDGYSVVIDSVFPDTPAYEAGLRGGDVILSVADEQLKKSSDFARLVNRAGVNAPLRLKVLRSGRVRTFQVIMKKRPLFF